ncbi:hypothetical protein [Nostoc sp.]
MSQNIAAAKIYIIPVLSEAGNIKKRYLRWATPTQLLNPVKI